MGCGQSSLKGEKVDAVGTSAPEQPIKQIKTNFTNPDYAADSTDRRETVYAPHEVNDPSAQQGPRAGLPSSHQAGTSVKGQSQGTVPSQSNQPAQTPDLYDQISPGQTTNLPTQGILDVSYPHDATGGRAANTENPDGERLEPYHTIEGEGDGLSSPVDTRQHEYPHERVNAMEANKLSAENGYTGQFASPGAKDEPYAHQGSHSHHDKASNLQNTESLAEGSMSSANADEGAAGKEKKKSWYARFQDTKRGPGLSNLSDEEYQKQTGMTREEMADYMQNTPGVAGNQPAGKLDVGPASGLAGLDAGNGLGGWGPAAGKNPEIH